VKRTGESSPPGPKRGAFFWKLYLSYSGLVLVSALVIGALVLSALRSGVLRDTEASLQRTARMLASLEATNPGHLWSDQLGRQVAEVAGDTGLHLTVLFANGTIAAESAPTLGGGMGGAALELPEFRGARHSNVGRATRVLPGAEVEHLFVAVPILLDFEMIGYVRLGLSLTGLTARQIELRDRVIAGTSFNVLIALGLGFFFAQHMTRPLAEIGAICRRLAAGNFEERIGLKRADEVGVVAATIDQMAGEVQRRVAGETRERQRLAALLSVMADGVIAVSARETIAYMNDVAARLLGLDSASVGQLFRERVRLAAVQFLLVVAPAQPDAPATGAGVAAAGAVGVDHDLLGGGRVVHAGFKGSRFRPGAVTALPGASCFLRAQPQPASARRACDPASAG
jgi:PAS domain-containing protein